MKDAIDDFRIDAIANVTPLALIAALLIEQARALSTGNAVYRAFRGYARFIDRSFNAGAYQQGALAWICVVVPIVAAVVMMSMFLHRFSAFALLLFDIGILYLTMGFRQFSHAYSDTLDALRTGDLDRARGNIAHWTGQATESMEASDIARVAIERGLYSAHRHVFGVIAWFAVFGAAGAVFYRLAAMLRDHWGIRREPDEARFGHFSGAAFYWIDWIPSRLSAIAFAVVGDFEDAMYCWRTQSDAWPDDAQGVVLASGAGALGVRLGGAQSGVESTDMRAELGMGDEADAELMTSAIGLIWRALVLWLAVLVLVSVASWLG